MSKGKSKHRVDSILRRCSQEPDRLTEADATVLRGYVTSVLKGGSVRRSVSDALGRRLSAIAALLPDTRDKLQGLVGVTIPTSSSQSASAAPRPPSTKEAPAIPKPSPKPVQKPVGRGGGRGSCEPLPFFVAD